MNEKKQMEIVVSADTTKAKTSLQRLADYMENKFKADKSTKIELSTAEAKARLIQMNDTVSKLKSEIKDIDVDDKHFGDWAKELEDAELEATKLKDALKEANTETKTSGNVKEIGNAFEKAGKKSRKFVLSLFSVRSVWLLISKASRQYMSENEDVTNKVAGAWSYLGNLLGPIIEKIVSWLQYGIAYLNVFLKALTGIDFLAKSIQKSTAKANKEAKKTLSEMDEIVNLDLDKGNNAGDAAGALSDIANLKLNPKIVEFLEKLAKALKTIWKWAKKAWDFLEEHFGVVGAAAIVGGLALIIGNAVTGTGLLGIAGLLKSLATVGVIAIGVTLLYDAITGRSLIEDLKSIYQGMKDIKEIGEGVADGNKALKKSGEELIKTYDKMSSNIDTLSKTDLNNLYNSVMNNIDANAGLIDSAEDCINIWSILNGTAKNYKEQIDIAREENDKYASTLQIIKEKLEKDNEQLDKNSSKYKENKARIDEINKSLDKINNYNAKAKVTVDADTSKAENKLNNLLKFAFPGIGNLSSGLSKLLKFSGGYSTGGFPTEGQMFIANESGPELVGNIGSSTAVVNNQQIVDSVSQGVANAVAGVLGSQKSTSQNATYLYINGSEFAKAVYSDMQTESQRRNTNTSIRRA